MDKLITVIVFLFVLVLFYFHQREVNHENVKLNYWFHGTSILVPPSVDDEAIKREILSTLPSNMTKTISLNLQRTSQSSLKSNWFIGTTSCPFQIRRSSLKQKSKLPNAIGIGTGKSGTGTLAFLDCHPDIVFRAFEPNVYPTKTNGDSIYRNKIPFASEDEFLIEKSPQYSRQYAKDGIYGCLRNKTRA